MNRYASMDTDYDAPSGSEYEHFQRNKAVFPIYRRQRMVVLNSSDASTINSSTPNNAPKI